MTIELPVTNNAFAREILTVAQLNQAVGQLLERSIPALWVRGEISNFTQAASGHWYFTLKDSRAAVRAVMFRSRASAVGFVPRAGDQVEIRARVSLYEPRGDYQLQADAMRRAGLGNLYEAFLRLKEQLASEGLFDPARKREPVRLPRAIGVITSLHAAALRDVLSALARRAPQVPVIIYPAPVQGADAASKLAAQLRLANERAEVDTLLLVRGGGSIEDLWSFNDEDLARQVAVSEIPVISGVGHETDFTIVDFVSDLRAPTPTAAAELACAPRAELLGRVMQTLQTMVRGQQRRLERAAQRLDRATAQLVSPAQRLQHQRERLNSLQYRLASAWSAPQGRRTARVNLLAQRLSHRVPDTGRAAERLAGAVRRLGQAQARLLVERRNRLAAASAQLRALDPGNTLARGYAIARDEQGRIVRDAAALSAGQPLDLSFAQGGAQVQVQSTRSTRDPS
ncbi:exodeoxyribonuclease VII large subunit [Achromobacter mucicolens]|jgi:exodeoxyribonuclease VII large subunit|uniref:exodeoxyribonuclease VII large subunit n=1 Tax=Achromobacter mucicolens TaxID=1389922 RepID=UPI000795F35C|nr:exodeoxyribonuclease VII large subunit [Achromobacter mucicolens]KXJ64604.1 exodeoxyribonuclease VII large subunit [Achromobacter xylosoxidans]MCP2515784.1 exodeoxyribonuclease VII large subunit [Achromobacter mucicolens]